MQEIVDLPARHTKNRPGGSKYQKKMSEHLSSAAIEESGGKSCKT